MLSMQMMKKQKQKTLKLFINKWSQLQKAADDSCLYVFASIVTNCRLEKEPLYIPFVFICPMVGEMWSVIINEGLDDKFEMITKGYSLLTDYTV